MAGVLEGMDKNLFILEIKAHDDFISECNFRLNKFSHMIPWEAFKP